jgi:hypothetical protein
LLSRRILRRWLRVSSNRLLSVFSTKARPRKCGRRAKITLSLTTGRAWSGRYFANLVGDSQPSWHGVRGSRRFRRPIAIGKNPRCPLGMTSRGICRTNPLKSRQVATRGLQAPRILIGTI